MKVIFCLITFVWFLLCPLAHAELTFRNGSPLTIQTAVGEIVNGKWQSSGWWTLNPGESAVVVGGNLTNRYYYSYAETPGGRYKWTGKYPFCAPPEKFTLADDACPAATQTMFDQVDVGNAKSYVLQFTGNNMLDPRLLDAVQRNIPFLTSLANQAPQSYRTNGWQDIGPCDIQYGVSRSPFQITINGNQVSVTARLAYWLSVSHIVPILGRQGLAACGCDGQPEQNADVTLTTIFGITQDGKIVSKTRTTNFSFPTRCEVTIFDIDVTGYIQNAAQPQLDRAAASIDSRIGEIDVSRIINARELYQP